SPSLSPELSGATPASQDMVQTGETGDLPVKLRSERLAVRHGAIAALGVDGCKGRVVRRGHPLAVQRIGNGVACRDGRMPAAIDRTRPRVPVGQARCPGCELVEC